MSGLSPLSAELALLAACDLADDALLVEQIEAATLAGIDWQRFARLARGNDMAGLVAARLGLLTPGRLPPDIAEDLGAFLQSNTVLQLSQTSASAKLIRSLESEGVKAVVLKGMALSHMLYGANPHWRSSTDIDVLIDVADLQAADKILQSIGYVRHWPVQGLPLRGKDMFLHLANVFEYVSPGSGQLVELHHRITLNPHWMPGNFEDLYAASVEVPTRFGPVRGLDGPCLVSYLCWHAFAHFGFRMKWFCDIVRALRRTGAETCAQLCPPGGPYAPAPIALADQLIAAIMPAVRGEATVQPASGPWLAQANRVISDMENPSDVPTSRSLALLPRELRFRLFLTRLSPNKKARAYELMRATSDPRDVELLGLGMRWAWFYGLVGPLLAMRRFALGLLGKPQPTPPDH